MRPTSTIAKRAQAKIKSFNCAVAGVASIEFAFLIPILMLMAFGTFEVGRAVIVHKRLQRATDMVADLVARESGLGATAGAVKQTLDGIMRAAEHSIWPYNKANMKMAIMSVRASMPTPPATTPQTTIEWSYGYNGAPHAQCPSPKALPQQGMVVAGNAVIMVESEYAYTPLLTNIIPGLVKPMTFKDTMVYSPRNSCVDVAGQQCSQGCGPVIN